MNPCSLATMLLELESECKIPRKNPEAIANASQAWADFVDLYRDEIARALVKLATAPGMCGLILGPAAVAKQDILTKSGAPLHVLPSFPEGVVLMNGDQPVAKIEQDPTGLGAALWLFGLLLLNTSCNTDGGDLYKG